MTTDPKPILERVAARLRALGRERDTAWLRVGESSRIDPAAIEEIAALLAQGERLLAERDKYREIGVREGVLAGRREERVESDRRGAVLLSLEWVATGDPFDPSPPTCPVCDGVKPHHYRPCRLADELETIDGEPRLHYGGATP